MGFFLFTYTHEHTQPVLMYTSQTHEHKSCYAMSHTIPHHIHTHHSRCYATVVVEGPAETEPSLSAEPVVVVESQPAEAVSSVSVSAPDETVAVEDTKPKGPFSYASAIAKKVPAAPQAAKPIGTRTAKPSASPNAPASGESPSPPSASGGDAAASRAPPRKDQVRVCFVGPCYRARLSYAVWHRLIRLTFFLSLATLSIKVGSCCNINVCTYYFLVCLLADHSLFWHLVTVYQHRPASGTGIE